MHGRVYAEIGVKEGLLRDEQMRQHKPVRDKKAWLEKKLGDALYYSGYRILNVVYSKRGYYGDVWNRVFKTFSVHFPNLEQASATRAIELESNA